MARGLRKRGKFWYMFTRINGVFKQKSTGVTKLKDAILIRDKWLTSQRGRPLVADSPLFSELCDIWEKREGVTQKGWEKSHRHMLGILREEFGQLRIHDLTPEKFRVWRSERGIAPATQNRYTTLLYSILRHCSEWELIDRSVYDNMRKVRLLRENNQRVRYLSAKEEKTLLEKCSERIKPIVRLAMLTGMRRGEILATHWSMVDLKNSVIRLPDSKSGKVRIVYLCGEAKGILEKKRERIGPLFTISAIWLNQSFKAAAKEAGLVDFRFHDLRHHFASRLAQQGISDRKLAALLGHTSTQMVQRYAHLSEQDLKDVVGLLDAKPVAKRVAKGTKRRSSKRQ